MTNKDRTEAEALFFQGARYMEDGDVAGAEACFSRAVLIAPEFA